MNNLKFSPAIRNEFDVARWRRAERAAVLLLNGIIIGSGIGFYLLGLLVGGA